mmetsp:Transcript_4899/g.5669  ORF Transcript_4899/g.5669 Transcript_4899/m.5669 type:complete len:401 (-) Transcript_4899:167-1369(-)
MKFCSSINVGLLTFSSKTLGSDSFSLHHPVSVSSSSASITSSSAPFQALSPRRGRQVFTTNKGNDNGNGNGSSTSLHMGSLLGTLRGGGGATAISSMITIATTALQTGPWGVPALATIASAVVIPLTLIRQGYSFSVGYGYSVLAMGVALWSTFGTDLLAAVRVGGSSSAALGPFLLLTSILFYGFRMGSFLLFREFTVPSKHEQIKAFDKSPLLKRLPLAMSVSIFYAFEVTPVLYACRAAVAATAATTVAGTGSIITLAGAVIAWTGALMEAMADVQKYVAKRGQDNDADASQFQGPTSWLYSLSRHPNYLGELLFWFGILVGGAPSFGTSPSAWLCSLLGFFGIFKVMTGATNGLEKKQAKKYGGQPVYDKWKARTSKLMPSEIVDSMLFGPYNLKK